MQYIPIPDQPTPAWLTAVLQHAGVLKQGAVTSVVPHRSGAFNSQISYLRVRYSDDALPDAPTRLVLKRNIDELWGIEGGALEAQFYNLVAALPDHPPVTIPCYAAAYDETSGNSYLLLQDLTDTHRQPVTRDQQISIVNGVPSAADMNAVVDTLAQLHAYWWQHPLLDSGRFDVGYWSRNAERFAQYLERRRSAWESLITQEAHWFPEDLRAFYEQILVHLPSHWEQHLEPRFRTKRHVTLVHGDAYFANFLCPKNPMIRTTYLLDWQSPTFDVGGYDLANLCATFWTSEQRRSNRREGTMLQRYYLGLQAHGVKEYEWDDLILDYQNGIIFWILMPVQDRYGGAGKAYWWPKMQCLVSAFHDWQCADLLGIERQLPSSS